MYDVVCLDGSGILAVKSDMIGRWSVTSYTTDAEDKVVSYKPILVAICRVGCLKVRAMTLEAACRDGPSKIGRAVNVSGTVYPRIGRCEIRDRQHVESLIDPGQKRLTMVARSNHNVQCRRMVVDPLPCVSLAVTTYASL